MLFFCRGFTLEAETPAYDSEGLRGFVHALYIVVLLVGIIACWVER